MFIPEWLERLPKGTQLPHTAWCVGGKKRQKWVRVKPLLRIDHPEHPAIDVVASIYEVLGPLGIESGGRKSFGDFDEWGFEIHSLKPGGVWLIVFTGDLECKLFEEVYCRDFPTALDVSAKLLAGVVARSARVLRCHTEGA